MVKTRLPLLLFAPFCSQTVAKKPRENSTGSWDGFGSDCQLLQKLVSGIVYQERNSRAIRGEFDAASHGLAGDGGVIPVEESYREERTAGKWPKKRETRQRS